MYIDLNFDDIDGDAGRRNIYYHHTNTLSSDKSSLEAIEMKDELSMILEESHDIETPADMHSPMLTLSQEDVACEIHYKPLKQSKIRKWQRR